MPSTKFLQQILDNKSTTQTSSSKSALSKNSEAMKQLIELRESYKYQIEDQPIYFRLRVFIDSIELNLKNIGWASENLDRAVREFENKIHLRFHLERFREKEKAVILAAQVELGLKSKEQAEREIMDMSHLSDSSDLDELNQPTEIIKTVPQLTKCKL